MTNPVVHCPSATTAYYITENPRDTKQKAISFGIAFSKEEEHKGLTEDENKSRQIFEGEAKDIAQYMDASYHTGAEVTKEFVCTSMTDKDIIHFSCHGIFNPQDPLTSGLHLYDGILTAREIMNLNLKANLVTLNACVTGLGDKTGGDELMGLSRAFLSAGVSSLIVTLWYVYSPSAKVFMEKFYHNYLHEKTLNKAQSLQNAQIDLIRSKEFHEPYYWAPYILVGDWQ
jgi:CHAT domain-containing protein